MGSGENTKGYFLRVMPQEKKEEEEAIDININTRDEAFKDPRVRTDNEERQRKKFFSLLHFLA